MYTSGKDIRLCTWINYFCPNCQNKTIFGLYEKSDISGILFFENRFKRKYHIMCKECSLLISVNDKFRKTYYKTFSESIKEKFLSMFGRKNP